MNKRLEELTKTESGQIEIWETLLAEEHNGDRTKINWEKIAKYGFLSGGDTRELVNYIMPKISKLYNDFSEAYEKLQIKQQYRGTEFDDNTPFRLT